MKGNTAEKNKKNSLLLLGRYGNGTAKQAVFLWLAVAVWTHFILSGVIMLAVFAFLMIKKESRSAIFGQRTQISVSALIASLSLVVSICYHNIIGILLSAAIFIILVFGCYANAALDKETSEKIAVITCYGSMISCIAAAFQNFVIFGYNPDYRPTAGAFNANYFGALIVFSFVLCLVRITERPDGEETGAWYRKPKRFYILTAISDAISLFLSESRSALLAVMACFVLFLLLEKRYVLFGAAVTLGAGVWVFCWFFPDALSWTNSLSFIITERFGIWSDAMRSYTSTIPSIIAGRGPMTYYMVWEEEGLYGAMHVHNIVLDTLLNTGAVGLCLYAILIVCFLKRIKEYRSEKDRTAFTLALLLLAGMFVQGIADVTIMWHQSAVLFFLLFFTRRTESAEVTPNGKSGSDHER